MSTFGTIDLNDYTIETYPTFAPVTWNLISSSAGIEITYPSELEGSITINEAIKNSEEVNIDTEIIKNSLHASIKHIFYNNYKMFISQSRIVTSSKIIEKDNLYVISVGQQFYGDEIKPGSFQLQINSIASNVTDDAEGNLIVSSSGNGYYVGNIFYKQGIAVISTDTSSLVASVSSDGVKIIDGTTLSLVYTANIISERHQINIKLNSTDFTTSPFNPSIGKTLTITSSVTESFDKLNIPKSGSNSWRIYDLMNAGVIKPYITSIGLYNEQHQLLAVAKLSQPIQRTFDTDQIFIVRFDTE